MNKLHPIFEQALAPFLKPVATRNDTPVCFLPLEDNEHGALCGDEGRLCDKCFAEAVAEHSWMRNVSRGAATGVMSEQDKQDLRDAGKGHKVRA